MTGGALHPCGAPTLATDASRAVWPTIHVLQNGKPSDTSK